MMNQKEAVFSAVTKVLGKDFKEGMDCAVFFKAQPELKKELIATLESSLNSGNWEIKNAQKNITSYIVGLVANYFRKDIRLNGGQAYAPANPGSKTGVRSPAVKAMRQLLKTLEEGSAEFIEVTSRIEATVAEIKASKAVAKIDKDNLPEDLKHLA